MAQLSALARVAASLLGGLTFKGLLLGVIALSGCVTPGASFVRPDLSRIAVGMSKDGVVRELGAPHEIAQQGDTEYFTYNFDHPFDGFPGIVASYYVRFLAGRVESFGRKGDFDSTKDPSLNIRVRDGVQKGCDLYAELKKLEDLRSSGTLTSDEFQTQKKKLLEKCG